MYVSSLQEMNSRSKPCFFLPLFLLFFSIKTQLSFAADTISLGDSLSGNQTITSQRGVFEFGFFTPGNSQNYYIGIWYKTVSKPTVVWVANRETPLPNTSSELTITQDGNLLLRDQSNFTVWSTNSTLRNITSPVAILLDSGNLVLRDGSNNTIWQSFDYPTDTWLPGGRLGFNKITGSNQLLTSWRNSDDPAPGPFSLELDRDGTRQYIIRWNGSERYWSSGVWNGQIFSDVPEMRSNYIYNFSFYSNDTGNYFDYVVYDSSILSRFVMNVSGQIQQLTWLEGTKEWNLFWSQPRDQCQVYSLCGAFGSCDQSAMPFCKCLQGFEPRSSNDWNMSDRSGGCVRKTPLKCDNNRSVNAKTDVFIRIPNMQLPVNPQLLTVRSAEECQSACLNDCSCTAYAYSSGCSIWNGNLLNLRKQFNGVGEDLFLRLAASEVPASGGNEGTPTAAIAAAAAGVVVLFIIVVGLLWNCRSRWSIKELGVRGSLVSFSYRHLQTATKNFSEKLGKGGFGSVFKGTLPDSTAIAVKKLEGLRQGEKQFRTEVSTIGTIQHVNLVRLRGFCSEGSQRLLVYDYMPKGSLDSHLFQNTFSTLDWKTRYQIALGIARGLSYLHEECRDCIIHCDIKPENILLDDNFCPKVADFGLAKLIGREFSRVLTTLRGTRGYLAPEWIAGIAITTKADVYSYGMMLFELISGRRNTEQTEDGKVVFFPTWAAKRITEDKFSSLLDPRLEGDANIEELGKACKVACWCIQDEEDVRPSMGQVVQTLEGFLELNMPPVPRSLQILVGNQEHIMIVSESSSDHSSQKKSDVSASSQAKSVSSTTSTEGN